MIIVKYNKEIKEISEIKEYSEILTKFSKLTNLTTISAPYFVVRVVHLQRSIKKCLRRIVPNSTAQQAFFISGRKCATITTKSQVAE